MAAIYKSPAGQAAVEAFYRRALDRWPVPKREVVVPTRHGDTFVVVSGDERATPIVLLHGSGANAAVWLRDVVGWSRDFRVHAVDVIGEPGFSAPSRPPLSTAEHAAWLDEVLDRLGIVAASFVGVSLGGWLALDFAVRRPARVVSLSLLSPSGIGSVNRLAVVKAAMLLMLGRWGLRRSLSSVAGGATMPRGASEFVTVVFQHFRPRFEPIPLRTDAELAALTMPLQVIVGANDTLIRSAETRERVRRLVPNAHLTYLEGAGHLLPPQTEAVAAFLTETAAAARSLP